LGGLEFLLEIAALLVHELHIWRTAGDESLTDLWSVLEIRRTLVRDVLLDHWLTSFVGRHSFSKGNASSANYRDYIHVAIVD
jgi:hypothetical protein